MDEELTSVEGRIHQELLNLLSPSQAGSVRKGLASLQQAIQSLNQLLVTEDQRRHANKPELVSHLPVIVVHFLTLADEQETKRNCTSLSCHARFTEVGEKLLLRIIGEVERHQERMEKLKVAHISFTVP